MNPPSVLEPLIEPLPPEVQAFLRAGGWLIGAGVLALLVVLVLLGLVRRLFRRRGPTPLAESGLLEDLATYPNPPALWGQRRLTLHGLPVRVRLVVAAPLGYEAGEVRPDQIEGVLDQVMPGLGQIIKSDKPRVRVWPTQLSYQGFIAAFRRNTQLPGGGGPVSRWVLLMGKGLIDRRPVALGLAFLADQDNTLARVTLEHPHQWMEVLRFKG
jgi:hypothetical protein